MKICVVGGNGNIGCSIVRQLITFGYEVTCFNRGLSGPVPDGAKIIRGDRYNRDEFERQMQAEKFDAAIDMFCFTREDALSSIRAFQGVRHFVNCSTVATYGHEFDSLPTTEKYPLRPVSDYGIKKAQADEAFLDAYRAEAFPATVLKPSLTYGPRYGLKRQIGYSLKWLDRIRKGMPIVVSGDGTTIQQFMHVDDAGLAFALVVGRTKCIGQTYNLVHREFTQWDAYYRTVMRVLGREVDMIGVPTADILALRDSGFLNTDDIPSRNSFFSADKLARDVPEFRQHISLEARIQQVIDVLDKECRIPNADKHDWEDRLIRAQLNIRTLKSLRNLKPWLKRHCPNVVYNYLRRNFST